MKLEMKTDIRWMQEEAGLADVIEFLSGYAATLLSSGATTLRAEKNISRMADFYHMKVSLTIMPRHVEMMLTDGEETEMRIVDWHAGINFFAITELSRLSWRVVEEGLDINVAMRVLQEVRSKKRLSVVWVTLMAGLANASFCRLFEGDYWAMLFVFLATVSGFYTKHKLVNAYGIDSRIATICVACISAVISCGTSIYGFGRTSDVALATSVLYLVPGIPYINAFSDFISGHYICALSWLMSALETTVCLGIGLVLGDYLLNL